MVFSFECWQEYVRFRPKMDMLETVYVCSKRFSRQKNQLEIEFLLVYWTNVTQKYGTSYCEIYVCLSLFNWHPHFGCLEDDDESNLTINNIKND